MKWKKSAVNCGFKVDRLQIIVVAKNITKLQLFINRMPKMRAVPQLTQHDVHKYYVHNVQQLVVT